MSYLNMNTSTFGEKVIIFFFLCGCLYLLQSSIIVRDAFYTQHMQRLLQPTRQGNKGPQQQSIHIQFAGQGNKDTDQPTVRIEHVGQGKNDARIKTYQNEEVLQRRSKDYSSSILTEKVEVENLVSKHYAKRYRRVPEVNCNALFNQNEEEIARADRIPIRTIEIEQYEKMTLDCKRFRAARGYITDYLSEEEKDFPIAYSILMYKNVEQAERLLRAIYRPQNIYCLHIDAKSSDRIFDAMERIANCFDNVFIPSKRISVIWGKMTVLEPELLCMKELWNRSKTWKYFINLTGQEFPLRTNYELVKILKVYNGSNDVEATLERSQERWEKAPPPPYGITPTKGAVHVAVSRGFVDYVLHDKRAQAILDWTNLTKIPDETFFSTLNHNPSLGVPGSFSGYPETTAMRDRTKPYLARFKNRGRYIYNWRCNGMRVRGMCVFGHGDLARLSKRKELFANKFYLDYQPYVFGCLEELNFNLTRDQYLGKQHFNANWYSSVGFVLHKVK